MAAEERELSTSALAKRLGIPRRDLFFLLKGEGWIRSVDQAWILTAKGEFVGGRYLTSKLYGRYIVWPQQIIEHRALQGVTETLVVSAKSLGAEFYVSGRYINHVLAELGWLVPGVKGWRVTDLGISLGGVQVEDEESGVPYVKWPCSVIEQPMLVDAMTGSYGQLKTSGGDDLFESAKLAEGRGLDGHDFANAELAAICNWLYFAGLTHSCGRRLPVEGEHRADFYLPEGNIYIEYWGGEASSSSVVEKLAKRELYHAHSLKLVEISPEDIPRLDEVMARELLKQGVAVY
ncbi:MAG: hypothetical protein V7711_16440 [Pseudomonadales bacterium]